MNLIASVLHLDRRSVRKLRVSDPYSLHRIVYSLYEDVREPEQKSTSTASGILFADEGGDFSGRRILLLANRPPADKIDGQYGEVQSKEVPSTFLAHDSYRFKVIVNPTRRDHKSRKLIPVKGKEEIGLWFYERASSSWGFNVSQGSLQVDQVEVLSFKDKNSNQVTIAQAHVQGQLQPIDRDRFRESFSKGIGRARAFGCGLLRIVPIIDTPFD